MNSLKYFNQSKLLKLLASDFSMQKRFCSVLDDLRKKEHELLKKFPGGSVLLHKDETSGIATITLSNPEKKNSLTGTMMLDLEKAIENIEKWSNGRGIILHGENNTFCSGMDLSLVRELQKDVSKEQPYLLSSFMQRTLTRFYLIPMVSVALVQGMALGGGAELATSCDMRLMSQDAKIGFVQVKMGLSLAFGSSFRLVNIVGRQQALKLLTSAQVMNVAEAKERGLIDETLSEYNPLEEATNFLKNFTKGHPEVIAAAKQSITNNINTHHLDVINQRERHIFANLFGGPANIEALAKNKKF